MTKALVEKQANLSPCKHHLTLFCHCLLLLFGYAGAGWFSCAYVVPKFVWFGTLLVTLHLVRVGFHGFLPAFIWVSGLLSIGAIDHAWMWQMPADSYQVKPFVLLLVWFFSIGLTLLVAIAHRYFKQTLEPAQRFYLLTAPISLGLAFGVCFYQLFTLPRIQ